MSDERQRFVMVFRGDPEPGDWRDDFYRMKLLLKHMLRRFGFDCVEVRPEVKPVEEAKQ